MSVLFSILIPTMPSRRGLLNQLMSHLQGQPSFAECEIRLAEDEGKLTVGEKRNTLLAEAVGKFVAFVDDDDWVSDTYVPDIVSAIQHVPDLDCVGFYGEVSFKQVPGGRMYHSIACPCWTEEPGVYYRPPNHLNPIRREIAQQFKFRPIRFSEDHFWSLDVQKSGLIQYEYFLGHTPTYFYRCGTEKRQL